MKNRLFEIYDEIIFAAKVNKDFKAILIANPKDAIQERFGIIFPEDFDKKIEVEDQSDSGRVYFNIPNKKDLENMAEEIELSDEQMELIAGGDIALGIAIFSLGLAVYKLSKAMK